MPAKRAAPTLQGPSTPRRGVGTGRADGPTARAGARRTTAPILVRVVRDGIEESLHRGHVVEVDVDGRIRRLVGDPETVVTLRSTVKPFGLVALFDAGGVEAFDITAPELAIMASSHSGEDVHVRTIQALYRRAHISQAALACGSEGMPLDALTAARLARDGESAGPIRHMCSGQHSVFLLLCRLNGWTTDEYWLAEHPAQVAYRAAVARAFGTRPDRLRLAIDGCGIPTYAFPLREVARAYAMFAEPAAVSATDPRHELAPALTRIRDAMLAHPELVAGSRDRLDTSLMKAVPGRVVSKAGMEALRGIAILRGPRVNGRTSPDDPSGVALKIEDGGGYERGTWSASVETLRQCGVLDAGPLRLLARYHRPMEIDPHGRVAAESSPVFDLAPVGELLD